MITGMSWLVLHQNYTKYLYPVLIKGTLIAKDNFKVISVTTNLITHEAVKFTLSWQETYSFSYEIIKRQWWK
jgi:hypothetical protein